MIEAAFPCRKALRIKELTEGMCNVAYDISLDEGMEKIEVIKSALQESKVLVFNYVDHKGSESSNTVEPCQLLLKNSQWYLYGLCRERNEHRIFKLSRMWNLEKTAEIFIPASFPKPRLSFADVEPSGKREIKLKIHKSILDRILDYCPYEKLERLDEDHYITSLPFFDNDFYYDTIIGFGPSCECIGPKSVRNKIAKRISQMMEKYEF